MFLAGVMIINGVCVENELIFLPVGEKISREPAKTTEKVFSVFLLPHRTRCAVIDFHRRQDASSTCTLAAVSMREKERRVSETDIARERIECATD